MPPLGGKAPYFLEEGIDLLLIPSIWAPFLEINGRPDCHALRLHRLGEDSPARKKFHGEGARTIAPLSQPGLEGPNLREMSGALLPRGRSCRDIR